MISNIELLKEELKKRKQGNVEQTINELVVEFNRNKKNLYESFKVLGKTGYIQLKAGAYDVTWRINEARMGCKI